MAFASSAGARIAYIAEATFGTTPATPAFQILRVTGGGLRTNKQTAKSDELQADRNVREEVQLGQGVSGAYPFELSYGTLDDLLAGALFGTWEQGTGGVGTTDQLTNGATRRFFTFEETLELGATDSFRRFTGCMVNQLSLSIESRAKITGQIDLMGQKETLATAILSGATYTSANTNEIWSGAGSVGALSVAGVSPAPVVRRMSLQVNNNLRERPLLSSLYSDEFGEGHCDVTGSIEAYFASNALYQEVLDHGGGAVAVTLGQVTGEKYTIDLPNALFLDGAVQIGGQNDDVMVSIPIRAAYDATLDGSIKITRAVA